MTLALEKIEINFKLMPQQWEYARCTRRFMGYFAGRRYGKTYSHAVRLIIRALAKPYREITYVSPLSWMSREVYRAITRHPDLHALIVSKSERPHPEIVFVNGSRIKFRSFQRPEAIRSTGEDEVIIDEIQDPNICEEDVDQVVMPLLADRRGSLIVSGQFRGENWYFKRFHQRGQSQHILDQEGNKVLDEHGNPIPNAIFKSWRIPTSAGARFQSPEGKAELALQKSLLPKAVWDQEFECKPTANQRAVFDYEYLQRSKGFPRAGDIPLPPAHVQNAIGLDLGGQSDPTAKCRAVFDPTDGPLGKMWVIESHSYPIGTLNANIAKQISQEAFKYKAVTIADNTGGAVGGHGPIDAVLKFYRSEIRDLREFTFNPKTKAALIRNLCLQFEQDAIYIPAALRSLHTQLAEFEYDYKPRHGLYIYSAPLGKHDDEVVALALVLEAFRRGWATVFDSTAVGRMMR